MQIPEMPQPEDPDRPIQRLTESGQVIEVPKTSILVRVRFQGQQYQSEVMFDPIQIDQARFPAAIVRRALHEATQAVEQRLLAHHPSPIGKQDS